MQTLASFDLYMWSYTPSTPTIGISCNDKDTILILARVHNIRREGEYLTSLILYKVIT